MLRNYATRNVFAIRINVFHVPFGLVVWLGNELGGSIGYCREMVFGDGICVFELGVWVVGEWVVVVLMIWVVVGGVGVDCGGFGAKVG